MNPQHQNALLRLLTDKLHVLPGADDVPVGEVLQSIVGCVRPWNTALLNFWARHPKGHLVIRAPHGYIVGPQAVGQRTLENVAWVGADDASACSTTLLSGIAHIVDHLLGCGGAAAGPWLSDGGGLTEAWQQVGQRLQARFRLGYGPTPLTRSDTHAYLAWGFALYWQDRRALNVADPLLERLLRSTLFSDDFWQAAPLP